MDGIHPNIWAALVAGLGSQALGLLWFDRKKGLFGRAWGKYFYHLSDATMEVKGRPPKAMIARAFASYIAVNILSALVFAAGLEILRAAIPRLTGQEMSLAEGMAYGLAVWAGFSLPHSVAKVLWQFKNWRVVWIESGYEILKAQLWVLLFWFWR
jgi:hypothetical protein